MKSMSSPVVLLLALSGALALSLALVLNQGGDQGGKGGGNIYSAPGPVAGAGLPALLVAGGIYWLGLRKKKASAN